MMEKILREDEEARADRLGTGRLADVEAQLEGFIASLDIRLSSTATYRKCLRLFFCFLLAQNISQPEREHVVAWRESLSAAGKQASTIQSYLAAVRLFFRWAHQSGLYRNIAENVKGPASTHAHKRDALTLEQTVTMLDRIDRRSLQGLRDYALLTVMVTGGLRCVEVSRARILDLRLLRGRPVLFIQGKGRDEQGAEYIKIEPPVEAALCRYLRARGSAEQDAPLFAGMSRNNPNGKLSVRSISRIVKKALRNAGYDDSRLTAHSLRHTAVTLALLGGEKLEAVKDFARHATLDTTLLYSHAITRENSTCERTIASAIFPE